jgi:acetate kinase
LDTLVFAGGIGENSPLIRERICRDFDFLGISLDQRQNRKNAALISKATTAVKVRVIRTDEELMIARYVSRTIASSRRNPRSSTS